MQNDIEELSSLLADCKDLISSTDLNEYITEEGVSRLRLKLHLKNSTYFSGAEVKYGDVEMYSYFWLREDNSVILGWDNAPHSDRAEISFHQHIKDRKEPAGRKTLHEALSIIMYFVMKSTQD